MKTNDKIDMNIKAPLVTIGIPFYNAEKYLQGAIKSIFAQTFQNWELILLDDGSTDNSLRIANSIEDPRVKVISDGENKRLPARLNQIIDLAKGKYIARMDADDLCSTDRIQTQVDYLENNPNIDLVGAGIVYLGNNDKPLGHSFVPQTHEQICMWPYRTFGLCHPSIVARKLWYQANRYDETVRFGQDFDLWLRSHKHSEFSNITDALLYYRLKLVFDLKAMAITRIGSAKFIYRYCRSQNKLGKALYYSGMQFVKLLAGIAICTILSRKKYLARRYQPSSEKQYEHYRQQIDKIKNTKLPLKPVTEEE